MPFSSVIPHQNAGVSGPSYRWSGDPRFRDLELQMAPERLACTFLYCGIIKNKTLQVRTSRRRHHLGRPALKVKMYKNRSLRGLRPGLSCGSSRRSPMPLNRLRIETLPISLRLWRLERGLVSPAGPGPQRVKTYPLTGCFLWRL